MKKFERFEIPGLMPRPSWWLIRPEEIIDFCKKTVKGKCTVEASTPQGYPVFRLVYNDFVSVGNRVNWVSAVGTRNPELFSDNDKQTVMIAAGIHGSEIEGVILVMNLISLLETGVDLRGEKHPRLLELVSNYRLVLFPCVNMDGRSISPDHCIGADIDDCRRAGGGCWLDGTPIKWPQMKEHFPLPLDEVSFPGGYPNSNGYNIQLDAAPGNIKTDEAKALYRAAEEFKVDFFLNLHSQPGSPVSFITQPSVCGYPSQTAITNELRVLCANSLTALGYENIFENNQLELSARIDINNAVQFCSGAATATFEFTSVYAESFERIADTGYVMLETILEYGLKNRFCDRKNFLSNNKSEKITVRQDTLC
jgi:hypothetical protein